MVEWYTDDRLEAVQCSPFTMRHRFVGTVKISFDILTVERVVNGPLIGRFYAVIVVAESNVKTSVTDMFRDKWVADDMVVVDGLSDLCIAIYAHNKALPSLKVFRKAPTRFVRYILRGKLTKEQP